MIPDTPRIATPCAFVSPAGISVVGPYRPRCVVGKVLGEIDTNAYHAGGYAGIVLASDEGPMECDFWLIRDFAPYRIRVFWNGSGELRATGTIDFDQNSFANGDDYDLWRLAWELGEQTADFDGSGAINGDDFDAFMLAWDAGRP